MKRLACLLLVLILTLSCAACGAEQSTQTTAPATEAVTEPQPTQPALPRLTLEEPLTVLSADPFTVRILGGRFTQEGQLFLSVQVENRAAGSFQLVLDSLCLDGVQLGSPHYLPIQPGGSVMEVPLEVEGMELIGMTEPTDYLFRAEIIDEQYQTIASGSAHHYPQGQEKARVFRYEPEDEGDILMNLPEGRVVYLGQASPDYMDGGIILYAYAENLADRELSVVAEDLYLNGVKSELYGFNQLLAPNTAAITQIYMDKTALSALTVGKLETLRLRCAVKEQGELITGQYVNLAVNPETGLLGSTVKRSFRYSEPTPLIDTPQVTVTITGFNPSHTAGLEVNAVFENKTGDTLVVGMTPMINHFQYCSDADLGNLGYTLFMLPPKANGSTGVTIPISRMDYLGVGEMTAIHLNTRVLNMNDAYFSGMIGADNSVMAGDIRRALSDHYQSLGSALISDMTLISYPQGEEKDTHFTLSLPADAAAVCQGEGFQATYLGCEPTTIGSGVYAVNLYLENLLREQEWATDLFFECTAIVDGQRQSTYVVRAAKDSSAYGQFLLQNAQEAQEISLEVNVILRDNVKAPAQLGSGTVAITLP